MNMYALLLCGCISLLVIGIGSRCSSSMFVDRIMMK